MAVESEAGSGGLASCSSYLAMTDWRWLHIEQFSCLSIMLTGATVIEILCEKT